MLRSDAAAGCEVEALWHEYERGETPEARLVKDFDKVGSWVGGWVGAALGNGCCARQWVLSLVRVQAVVCRPSLIAPACPGERRRRRCNSTLPGLIATPWPPPPALPQLEMILQAHEYEGQQGMALQEFFDSTAGKWRTDLGRSWAEEVCRRRAERQQAAAASGGSGGGNDGAAP